MKKGLVLAGGGTRGSYQVGAVKALRELGEHWDIVTGTSIGALNGCMLAQKDYDAFYDLWEHIGIHDIIANEFPKDFDLDKVFKNPKNIASFAKQFINEKGVDVEPLIDTVNKYYSPERLKASEIDFGCVTVHYPTFRKVLVTKDMMLQDGADCLVSSASCWPAFPIHKFKGQSYIDGGYYDNCPIDFALRLGAEEIIAIDLNQEAQHPHYLNKPKIQYIVPQFDTGSFMNFEREVIQRNMVYGYNDTMKKYGKYIGVKYTINGEKIPSIFEQYYCEMLQVEAKINEETMVRGESVITTKLLKQQNKTNLSINDFCFGILDNLLDLCGAEGTKVYTFQEMRMFLLESFRECFDEKYPVVPSLDLRKVKQYAETLDTHGIVSKLIYQLIYPEHRVFSEHTVLTLFPFEEAMARMIIWLIRM